MTRTAGRVNAAATRRAGRNADQRRPHSPVRAARHPDKPSTIAVTTCAAPRGVTRTNTHVYLPIIASNGIVNLSLRITQAAPDGRAAQMQPHPILVTATAGLTA